MQRYHLTISPSSSSSASRLRQHLPDPPNDATLPLRGDKEGDGGRNKKKKKKNTSTDAFGSSVWNLSVYLATQCQRRAVDDAISGEDEATCAAAQGVAVKGWSASGWLTDWLTVPVPGYSKLYVLLYSVLFSRLNSFPAFVFSLRLQPLRCIPRATSICSFWDFGLLSGWVWVQVGLGSFGVSRSWHCTGEQEQQQHALEKQANNEANLFLCFLFFYYYVFFLDVLSSFFCDFSWGCCVFFHVTEPTALYYKTLEIFNMNLPFFLVIYNIILTVFCLIVFSDPIIVSPTPGAALSLRDL